MFKVLQHASFGVGRRGSSGGGDINLAINGTVTDYNIRNAALAAGWNGTSPVRVNLTINVGAVIRAAWPTNPALTTGAPWPVGSEIHITNNGEVRGAGGHGANDPKHPNPTSRNGQNGGDAFANWGVPCEIINNGVFGGGGGGGGRGADWVSGSNNAIGGSGGGGGGDAWGEGNSPAQDGNTTNGGSGGAGNQINFGEGAFIRGGTGGAGGNRGQNGGSGSVGQSSGGGGSSAGNQGSGGTAGRYATGNSNNTWLVNGTRLGGVAA